MKKTLQEDPEELVNFLKYIENPNKAEDSEEEGHFVKSLRKQINAIKKSREWDGRFMLLEEMIADERAEAKDSTYLEELFKEFNL